MIAYYFPPIGGIGSIRMARFAEYLSEFGWEPWVVAPERTPHELDPSLGFGAATVIRSRSVELTRRSRTSLIGEARANGQIRETEATGVTPTHAWGRTRLRHAAGKALQRTVLYPDPQVGWYPDAVRTALQAARTTRFDAVFSSAFPITAHMVARTISRRTGLPWIAEFRDPWADDLPRVSFRAAAARLEKKLANDATQVVMTSPAWAQHYGASWGCEVAVITNGCDPVPVAEPPEGNDAVLAHVGSYWPDRQDLTTVWKALAELRQSAEPIPRIRWVGQLREQARAQIDRAGLSEIVDVVGFVPQQEAIRLMASASMLFAAGPVDTGHFGRGWLPAKLFEYLASSLPVMFIGDREGDAAKLLAGHPGCWVVGPGDVEGAKHAIQAGLASGRHARDVESLSRQRRTAELAQLLDAVVMRDLDGVPADGRPGPDRYTGAPEKGNRGRTRWAG